jgi:hypothetical protein
MARATLVSPAAKSSRDGFSARSVRVSAPLRALPEPIDDSGRIARLDVRRRDRLGGTSTSTSMLPDRHG